MTQEKIEKASSYTEWAKASLNHIWASDDVNDTERIPLILGVLATEFAVYLDMNRRPTSLDDMLNLFFGEQERGKEDEMPIPERERNNKEPEQELCGNPGELHGVL